jgi:hypothetical protein
VPVQITCARSNYILQAWTNWREGTTSNIVDPTMRPGSTTEIMRCIHIGLLCAQQNVVDRPTMASVVLMLNSYSITLPVPSKPAFFMHNNIDSEKPCRWEHGIGVTESSERSQGNSIHGSTNEVSITELASSLFKLQLRIYILKSNVI